MITIDPNYQSTSGRMSLTQNWAITLPGVFNHRLDGTRMCVWRPGLQLWVSAVSFTDDIPIHERLKISRAKVDASAYDVTSGISGGLGRLSFRQDQSNIEGVGENAGFMSYYALAQGPSAQIMCAFYFEQPSDLEVAQIMAASLEFIGEEF